jgi:hypothetical protein
MSVIETINNEMKTKKCDDCGGLIFKINYYYTHLKSKKHINNHNKNNQPNILDDTSIFGQQQHINENIDNIIDVCNHIKGYIQARQNAIHQLKNLNE